MAFADWGTIWLLCQWCYVAVEHYSTFSGISRETNSTLWKPGCCRVTLHVCHQGSGHAEAPQSSGWHNAEKGSQPAVDRNAELQVWSVLGNQQEIDGTHWRRVLQAHTFPVVHAWQYPCPKTSLTDDSCWGKSHVGDTLATGCSSSPCWWWTPAHGHHSRDSGSARDSTPVDERAPQLPGQLSALVHRAMPVATSFSGSHFIIFSAACLGLCHLKELQ